MALTCLGLAATAAACSNTGSDLKGTQGIWQLIPDTADATSEMPRMLFAVAGDSVRMVWPASSRAAVFFLKPLPGERRAFRLGDARSDSVLFLGSWARVELGDQEGARVLFIGPPLFGRREEIDTLVSSFRRVASGPAAVRDSVLLRGLASAATWHYLAGESRRVAESTLIVTPDSGNTGGPVWRACQSVVSRLEQVQKNLTESGAGIVDVDVADYVASAQLHFGEIQALLERSERLIGALPDSVSTWGYVEQGLFASIAEVFDIMTQTSFAVGEPFAGAERERQAMLARLVELRRDARQLVARQIPLRARLGQRYGIEFEEISLPGYR